MQGQKSHQDKRLNVAVYGTVNGVPKRWQLSGTPQELEEALKLAVLNPPKQRFVTFPDVVLGNWEIEAVQIDFDNMTFKEVKYWCHRACYWYKLKGFVILESSMKTRVAENKRHKVFCRFRKGNYHVVFDRPVEWATCCSVRAWLAMESKNDDLRNYAIMQDIKKSSTLRISCKGDKPPPEVVYRFGTQNKMIKKYFQTRSFILSWLAHSHVWLKQQKIEVI